jgi:hypothetical protein
MKVNLEYFHDEMAANAFISGLQFVGHEDVAACGPKLQDGFQDGEENAWAVAIHDNRPLGTDGEPFSDPLNVGRIVFPDLEVGTDVCPLCGSKDWNDAERLDDDDFEGLNADASACKCDNCGKQWTANALKEIRDLNLRVEAGGVVPAGECPECGALCYPVQANQASQGEPDTSEPCAVITSVEKGPSSPAANLWIDFGSGEVEQFDFATVEQCDLFLEGACTVLNRLGLEDVHVFENEKDMLESFDEHPEIIVNPPFEEGGKTPSS